MTDEPREQEVIVGRVDSVIVKGESKWQVAVVPDGSQYPKKLWTKSAEQMQTLSALIGSPAQVLCNVSHWTKDDGTPVRSLWVDKITVVGTHPSGEATRAAGAVPSPQSAPSKSTGALAFISDMERQTSIERQTAIKCAVEYMALLPEELRSVEQMVAVAERVALFLASGEGAEALPF